MSIDLSLEELAKYLNNCGLFLLRRFEQLGNLADLDGAVSSLQGAIDLTPEGHPACLDNLGISLLTRFKLFGTMADLDSAISSQQRAVDLAPEGHPNRTRCLDNLGNSLRVRFERLGAMTDLDSAISSQHEAVGLTPKGDPNQTTFLNNLGISLLTRFERLGTMVDLDDAISSQRKAVDLTPEGHPDRNCCLHNLASSLRMRFERLGTKADLDSAISSQQEAVNLTPKGHPGRTSCLDKLGNLLGVRFDQFGTTADLDSAISLQHEAVDLTSEGLLRAIRLGNLGTSLLMRFRRFETMADLDRAISLLQEAVDLIPKGHPNRAALLGNLGSSLRSRFERFGTTIADLDGAISSQQEAVDLTPEGHFHRTRFLINLGDSLRTRFWRLGTMADLDGAISSQQEAVNLTPEGHADQTRFLDTLGLSLRTRYDRLGTMADLDRAISSQQRALSLTPEGHTVRTRCLNNLGSSLWRRFERFGKMADLHSAISSQQEAVDRTPEGHPTQVPFLNDLGLSLLTRFERLGTMADLDGAISSLHRAVDLTPKRDPGRTRYLNHLASSLATRFERLGTMADLTRALQLSQEASTSATGVAADRFRSAVFWSGLARKHNHLEMSLRGYEIAISLLPILAWRGLDVSSRLEQLRSISRGVASDAASCAIDLDKPELAIELLDQGRTVFWTQTSELRTELSDLRSSKPELAEQLDRVRQALDQDSFSERAASTGETEGPETVVQRYHRLAEEWDALVGQVRRIRGFETFLLRTPFQRLRDAAQAGPVVVLNASQFRCDALIVTSAGPVKVIPLVDLNLQTATQLVTTLRNNLHLFRLKELSAKELDTFTLFPTLRKLWTSICVPILPHIVGKRPHVWWCPTGPFSFLPLHAAGLFDSSSGIGMADRVTSSYTSTLTALLRSRTKSSPSTFRMMVVGLPETLENVSPEVDELQRLTSALSLETVSLQGPDATVERVLTALKDCSWAHFSCHGHQDIEKPMQSHLRLYDGNLTVAQIARDQLCHANLAFLSACHTASGTTHFEDEAFHIAAGLQFAGFGGVIGTLWAVRDKHAPVVSREVYEHLFRKNQSIPDSTNAAVALRKAICRIRRDGAFLFEWVPFIHIGA
jgi:tetratricopeptide (TPR) repeat protein